MMFFAIGVPALAGIFILLIIIKFIKQKRIDMESRAYFEGEKMIADKYCCNIKMRLISLDCHYSGGGTSEYFVCYVCHSQVEYEKPVNWHTGNEKNEELSIRSVEIGVQQTRNIYYGGKWKK